MKEELVKTFNEMNGTEYETFEQITQEYSAESILDAWLKYEGINGYTRKIIKAVEAVKEKEQNLREHKIAETASFMTDVYNNMVRDGEVYPISSDEVNSVELMQDISDLAIKFEDSNYEEWDWMLSADKYFQDHLKDDYRIKK